MTYELFMPFSGGGNEFRSELTKMFQRRQAKRKHKKFTPDLAMTGLLFARPTDPFAQTNIIPELDYFNSRSGEHMDLFCIGYTKKPRDPKLQRTEPVTVVKHVKWWFDNDAFVRICKEIEEASEWKYSGGTDLLIANARSSLRETSLDYSSVIPCKLEQMQSDKAINSVREFLEKIFREAEHPTPGDPVSKLSDKLGITVGLSAIKRLFLNILLKGLDEEYTKARHFVLADLSKKK
jgi:hypothetical protein